MYQYKSMHAMPHMCPSFIHDCCPVVDILYCGFIDAGDIYLDVAPAGSLHRSYRRKHE